MTYIYLIISIALAIASFLMIHQKNGMIVRATGMILGYLAAIIAMKVYYLLT